MESSDKIFALGLGGGGAVILRYGLDGCGCTCPFVLVDVDVDVFRRLFCVFGEDENVLMRLLRA